MFAQGASMLLSIVACPDMGTDTVSSENTKTLGALVITAILASVAFFTYPWIAAIEPDAEQGKTLFDPELMTPTNVGELEIVRYDAAADVLQRFEVRKNNRGQWTIPSSDNYPADAERQLTEVIAMLEGLTITDVMPNAESLFADYEVMEPDVSGLTPGQNGIGVLVNVKDQNGDPVGSLIVGRADEDQPQLRYVRRPGQPLVYVVEFDPSALRTDFRDWINIDLLEIDAVDIARVDIDDYQLVMEEAGRLTKIPRFRVVATSEGTRWRLDQFLVYDDEGQPSERTVEPTEMLNHARLNQTANALDRLEIVDVVRKPAGLGADLRAAQDQALAADLTQRGFLPVPDGAGGFRIQSVNGDIAIDTRDGIRYTIRFGDVRGEEASADIKLDRYMMVTTSVNAAMFPEPEPPGTPAGQTTGAPAPAAPNPTGDDPAAGGDDEEAQRRAEAAYRRAVEERQTRLAAAQQKVDDLNQRFADWYYVVSEASYRDVRFDRNELINGR